MTNISADRLAALLARAAAAALVLAFIAATPAQADEFDGACAMGLASGEMVKTDCSVNWADTDGKTYCFGSEASKEAFLQNPTGNLQKARDFLTGKQVAQASGPIAGKKELGENDVTARVEEIIAERSKDGAFVFRDPKLDADLNLIFEQIKIVRGMSGYGWFANVIFHDKNEPKKQYAIDFWFKPEGDELKLMDIRVQKGPKRDGDTWIMVTRLPVAWWWLPVSEHPGDMEVVRGWHIMSAVHNYIAANKNKDGALDIKDDETGETIPMEFVEMHQPIRKLKADGQYFACTDFRKVGSKDEYYDVDFWVDETTGKLKVNGVKLHKVPVNEDGIWTQVPRYKFEDTEVEVTN